jgi:hypothetical protein
VHASAFYCSVHCAPTMLLLCSPVLPSAAVFPLRLLRCRQLLYFPCFFKNAVLSLIRA